MKTKFILLVVILFLVAGCAAKSGLRYVDAGEYDMGKLPSDMCYVNDLPLILSATMDEGDLGLTYISNTGDVVVLAYFKRVDALNQDFEENPDRFVWKGDLCPR